MVDDGGARVRELDDRLREDPDRVFLRIAEVDGTGDIVAGIHQRDQAPHQVVDIAERARLRAVTVEGDRRMHERLHDEVRHDAAVARMHPRTVGVEDARHLDAQRVLAVVVEEQRLGAALALVVA